MSDRRLRCINSRHWESGYTGYSYRSELIENKRPLSGQFGSLEIGSIVLRAVDGRENRNKIHCKASHLPKHSIQRE